MANSDLVIKLLVVFIISAVSAGTLELAVFDEQEQNDYPIDYICYRSNQTILPRLQSYQYNWTAADNGTATKVAWEISPQLSFSKLSTPEESPQFGKTKFILNAWAFASQLSVNIFVYGKGVPEVPLQVSDLSHDCLKETIIAT